MTLTQRPTLDEIYSPIDSDLKVFSTCLRKELASQDDLIQKIHEHILQMTGKFLRPALTILTSKIEGKNPEEVIRLSAAIELIHTATLVHDDIIDNSDFRRNQPSVHARWGRDLSIISGDYLYAKAFLLLAGLNDTFLNKAFATCAHIMCEGEMKQVEKRNQFLMSEEIYLKIIHQKTAALFQAACMGGAYYSGTGEENIHQLGQYGLALGMAFQIVDDCLDLVGETKSLGKTTGLDLTKNDMTLPLLYLLEGLPANRRDRLTEQMKNNEISFNEIKKMALEEKAVERAMTKARGYIETALESVGAIPESIYKQSLIQLANHCIDRVR